MNLKDILPVAANVAKNQGFAFLVILAIAIMMGFFDYQRRADDRQHHDRLEQQVRECTQTVIEYYQNDHETMLESINANTRTNEELLRALQTLNNK